MQCTIHASYNKKAGKHAQKGLQNSGTLQAQFESKGKVVLYYD